MNRRVNHTATKKPKTKQVAATRTSAKLFKNKSSAVGKHSQYSIFQAWVTHHKYSCVNSLQRLLHPPWQSFLTWMVVAIALVLPLVLYLGLNHAQQLGSAWKNSGQLSAFLLHQTKPLAITQLQQRLSTYPELQHIELITPEQAKQEFQQHSGLGNVLQSLENNPLPAVLTLLPADDFNNPESLEALKSKLEAEPLIELVQLDIAWLQRLHQIMGLAQQLVLVLGALLSLGVLLVIGNTIRLAIENRRHEIVVIKMVGGTDGFVRRPFLYTGFWYGIGGGLLALILLFISVQWISDSFQQLVELYENKYSLTFFNLKILVLVVFGSGFIGWSGAWLAVEKHLKEIEPS
ncbi:hypothetical protein AB835_08415 [Candidatus Endobugula sertula]|uniref:Cell division protein FtsX n=1 Tax=Candidatus Endobugula sertula TaxID=62101 RepID=A0A1D2QPM7_9GAMM|nr:hypothetical protein AB835_08415 [Candidatus Endobugula sertula]